MMWALSYEPDDPARSADFLETAEIEGSSVDQLRNLVKDELRRNASSRLRL
jgi:hypothetical protein